MYLSILAVYFNYTVRENRTKKSDHIFHIKYRYLCLEILTSG